MEKSPEAKKNSLTRCPKLSELVLQLPFPVAVTADRLRIELERQDPVGTLLAVRDAMESAIKMIGCIVVADLQQATDRDNPVFREIISILLNGRGISAGHWATMIRSSLAELRPVKDPEGTAATRRYVPKYYDVFFDTNGRASKLSKRIDGGDDNFIQWRNNEIGHGVLKQDRSDYVDQCNVWTSVFVELCERTVESVKGWELVEIESGRISKRWQGVLVDNRCESHEHVQAKESVELQLASQDGRRLSLGPLLTVQRCLICDQPAAFFLDRFEMAMRRTTFLEYFRGHKSTLRNWKPIESIVKIANSIANFDWHRDSFDSEEIAWEKKAAFRDFELEYARPGYLFDAVEEFMGQHQSGYIFLSGAEGTGKTFFVRGLDQEPQLGPVLTYHILPGALSDYRTFVSELNYQARLKLPGATQEIQTRVDNLEKLHEETIGFIKSLMRQNRLESLLIAIDGIDEVRDTDSTAAIITDLLPPAGTLPLGCYFVVTMRDELSPRVAERINEFRSLRNSSSRFLEISPSSAENQALLEMRFGDCKQRGTIRRAAAGVFLYESHWHRVKESIRNLDEQLPDFPDEEGFYHFYLRFLEDRVGATLFKNLYLPLLIQFTVVRSSVTRGQLSDWGFPSDRLRFAMPAVADMLTSTSGCSANLAKNSTHAGDRQYSLAHNAFTRFIIGTRQFDTAIASSHHTIAKVGIARFGGRWGKIDRLDAADLYALRFGLWHAEQAKERELAIKYIIDRSYAKACVNSGTAVSQAGDQNLALDLIETAIEVSKKRHAIESARGDSNYGFALINKGIILGQLGRFHDSIESFEAAELHFRLVASFDDSAEFRGNHARSMRHLAEALDVSERSSMATARARVLVERAIDLFRQLCKEEPDKFQDELASALMERGLYCSGLGQVEQSLRFLEEASSNYLELASRTDLIEHHHGLAKCFVNLSSVILRNRAKLDGRFQNEVGESLEVAFVCRCHLEEAVSRLELVCQRTTDPEAVQDKILANAMLADIYFNTNDRDRGIIERFRVVADCRRVVEKLPSFKNLYCLADHLAVLGSRLDESGRTAEALPLFDESVFVFADLSRDKEDHSLAGLIRARRLRFVARTMCEQWDEAIEDLIVLRDYPIRLCHCPEVLTQISRIRQDCDRMIETSNPKNRLNLARVLRHVAAGGEDSLLTRIVIGRNCPVCDETMSITTEGSWICQTLQCPVSNEGYEYGIDNANNEDEAPF